MRNVSQRHDRLEMPGSDEPVLPASVQRLLAVAPIGVAREKCYVATVDGELCAYIALRPQSHRYRWDVVDLAAGSPRLDATDDVCVELWTALLEYAIQRAGAGGAKRLFASVSNDGPALRSLRAAGFERYATFFVITGLPGGDVGPRPDGMREQEDSDVWSIHQLYHQITPRSVQFAEALTSSVWELPQRPSWRVRVSGKPRVSAYVVETAHGIVAYCQVQRRRDDILVRLLVLPECRDLATPMVLAAIRDAGVDPRRPTQVIVPGFARELIRSFEAADFHTECERIALVRHTTVPAIVRARPVPLAVESRERVPKGVPTYIRGLEKIGSMTRSRGWSRTEWSNN